MSSVWCIVVAGGSGRRFGGLKQLESIGGRRVLDHAVSTARAACDGVVAVLPVELVGTSAGEVPGADAVVAGGATRVASAHAGLDAVPSTADVVLVHDAARPLATRQLFNRVIDAVRAGAEAVVPAVPIPDTVRTTGGELVDRSALRASQTPQGFIAGVLRRAHDAAAAAGSDATDDAALAAAQGTPVTLIEGEPGNRKITEPFDLLLAEAVLATAPPGEGPGHGSAAAAEGGGRS
jgi:2-C-methyl-D-erythritol 4-phosphate cytidylyltransferase